MDMNRQEWKEKAAEMSGVPKDVAMGLPILTITRSSGCRPDADRLKSTAGNWKSSITPMMR